LRCIVERRNASWSVVMRRGVFSEIVLSFFRAPRVAMRRGVFLEIVLSFFGAPRVAMRRGAS